MSSREGNTSTPVEGKLEGLRIVVSKGKDFLIQKGYGEEKDDMYVLAPYEALYLAEKGKLRVFLEGEELDIEDLRTIFLSKDPDFHIKYLVYKDIRTRGYVIKTGFKFGAHFRVYPRGKKPGEAHTKYVIWVLPEEAKIPSHEIARYVRLARNIRTTALIAVVDAEDDIVYYKIEREEL